MKHLFIAILFATCPAAAIAETQLERLEVISERMTDAMFDAMIRMVERDGGNATPMREAIPDTTWDASYRDAGACLLDRFTAASSVTAVDKMLDDMEAFVPQMADMDLDSMGDDATFLPEGISEDFSVSVNQECGLTGIMMDRMDESGFMAAMMQSMSGN